MSLRCVGLDQEYEKDDEDDLEFDDEDDDLEEIGEDDEIFDDDEETTEFSV